MIYEVKKNGELELFSYTVYGEKLDELKKEMDRVIPTKKFKFIEQPIDTVVKKK